MGGVGRDMLVTMWLCALAPACTPASNVTPPIDFYEEPIAPESCDDACANLRAHACSVGGPSATGETCEAMCQRDQSDGVGAMLHPRCVAEAKTLETLRGCGVRCAGGH